MKSNLLQLNISDFFHGLLVAVLGAVLFTIKTSLELGVVSFNWPEIGNVAMLTSVAYLIKKLGSNNAGELLTRNRK